MVRLMFRRIAPAAVKGKGESRETFADVQEDVAARDEDVRWRW